MSIDRIPLPRTGGALWLCGLADIADDPDAAMRYADAATTVVCLAEVHELSTRYAAYVEWLHNHRTDAAMWFPIHNFTAESADATMPLLEMIVDRLEAGHGVVMHCALGRGRAGTMAACLLMVLGADQDAALRTVAAHRSFAGPGNASQWALVDDVARAATSAQD